MFDVPIQVALNWPVPNYTNPVTRGPLELWLLSGFFLLGASICVTCRLWSRVFVRRWFGLDDLCIVIGYCFAVAVTAIAGIGTTHYDWDRHLWDANPKNYSPSLKVLYFARIFWGLASSVVRLSVICLYYRLLKACQAPRHFFIVMHATTLFNTIILLYYIFSGIFACNPVYAYWTWPTMKDARCFNDGKSWQAAGVINTFAELQLAVLPLIAVYVLRVRRNQRWGIISLLSLGFLVALVGCFRTYYIWRAITSYDLTWYAAPQWICSEVENYLALMCACAVPLRPLVGRTVRHWEKKPSNPTSQTSRESTTSFTISQNRTEATHEDVADWASMMRKIDLEGIADDGYGYTVTISGPSASPESKTMSFLRAITVNLLRPREKRESAHVESQRLEMTLKTEVKVDESERPPEKRGRWGSVTTESSGAINSTIEPDSYPPYLGDPSIMTSHTDGSERPMSGTRFPYPNESLEDVRAIPNFPHAVYKPA